MATPQWTADIAIDEVLVCRVVGEQFPEFSRASVRAFGAGWDNAAFLIDERVLFRFPRRQAWAKLIAREVAILPLVAPQLTLPISAPSYVGAATPAYPYVFAGYPLLAATTACSLDLEDDVRAAMAQPLGAFLRVLHAIDPQPLVARGLPPDEIGRLDPVKRLSAAIARVETIERSGLAPGIAHFIAWLEANPPITPADDERRFVHGDLYARHVLLSDENCVAGIIDWGDMHLGDPAFDLSVAHLMLPAHAHAGFRSAYGSIDDRTWSVARYRAITHAILELDYGIREDDADMRRIGIAALDLMHAYLANAR